MFGFLGFEPPTKKVRIEELSIYSKIKWYDGTFKEIERITSNSKCDFFTIWTVDNHAWNIKAGKIVEISVL